VSRIWDVVTFDCYGTLIDWETGISTALLTLAKKHGWNATREGLLAAYHQVEPVVEAEHYRSYRDTLGESGTRVARTFGWELPESDRSFLAESLWSWRPFPDTNAALERLADAGIRLGILSNVDDDLLEQTRRHFTVPFEFAVTAEQVRSYKPELGHFLAARERIGDVPWLHAAQSYFHDILPCVALNIPCAWVNRKQEAPSQEERPGFEVCNLEELAGRIVVED
jgi:2-haloacid dehalogenase/putative hydrolase of the HAD superfamily